MYNVGKYIKGGRKLRELFSVIFILAPVLMFGILDKPLQMIIILFAGFASAVVVNIDKFESFKAGQLEAKLREADKIITKATATIEQLQSVTEPLLNSNLSLLIYDGTIDGMKVYEKEKMLNDLLKIKKEMNLNGKDIDKLIFNAKSSIANSYFTNIKLKIPGDINTNKMTFFDKYTDMENYPSFPSIKEVDEFFEKYPDLLTDDVNVELKEFKGFVEKYLDS